MSSQLTIWHQQIHEAGLVGFEVMTRHDPSWPVKKFDLVAEVGRLAGF